MKKNILAISLVLISLIALTACTSSKPTTTGSGFFGGKDGLVISYVNEEPPAKVYDSGNNAFRISLLLENKGEHDVAAKEVLATLAGIDYDSFSIKTSSKRNDALIGKVKRDSAGKAVAGDKSTDISFEANYKSAIAAPTPFPIVTNLCYLYGSEAISQLCLRKDVTARAGANDACKIEDPKTVSSSGAPVQVTAITERAAGQNKVSIGITIENKGKGDIYGPSFISKDICVDDLTSDLKGKVKVKVFLANNKPAISCAGLENGNEGTVQLIMNSQRITCEIDTSAEQVTTFQKDLKVELSYVYKDSISKQLIVDRTV